MIRCIHFEELRCFVAVRLFPSGGISFISFDVDFDRLGGIFGQFRFSVLELNIVLIWFGRHGEQSFGYLHRASLCDKIWRF